jgi:outer membrane immunogenic protein
MNGSDVWAAYNVASSLAAVAQFSVQHASNVNGSSADLTLKSYLFGARYSRGNSSRFAPFVQALFGGSHAGHEPEFGRPGAGEYSELLGACCRRWTGCFIGAALRVRAFEAEYFRTQFPNGANDRQNNLRLSAGLILNWGKD